MAAGAPDPGEVQRWMQALQNRKQGETVRVEESGWLHVSSEASCPMLPPPWPGNRCRGSTPEMEGPPSIPPLTVFSALVRAGWLDCWPERMVQGRVRRGAFARSLYQAN